MYGGKKKRGYLEAQKWKRGRDLGSIDIWEIAVVISGVKNIDINNFQSLHPVFQSKNTSGHLHF